MDDLLKGWDDIAAYIGVHRCTAQDYQKTRGLRVHRLKGGVRPRVYALRSELDSWLGAGGTSTSIHQDLDDQILRRIGALSIAKSLYRKDFVLRFRLQPARDLGFGKIEIEYDLVNGSNERQPYTQEVTIDDCERGHVEAMSVSANGKPIYSLKRPKITATYRGYVSYRGPAIMIEPSFTKKFYKGQASWVVRRNEADFWYLHAGIPTFGITVETSAPPDFEITPSFCSRDLFLKGEHVDITWKRRPSK